MLNYEAILEEWKQNSPMFGTKLFEQHNSINGRNGYAFSIAVKIKGNLIAEEGTFYPVDIAEFYDETNPDAGNEYLLRRKLELLEQEFDRKLITRYDEIVKQLTIV